MGLHTREVFDPSIGSGESGTELSNFLLSQHDILSEFDSIRTHIVLVGFELVVDLGQLLGEVQIRNAIYRAAVDPGSGHGSTSLSVCKHTFQRLSFPQVSLDCDLVVLLLILQVFLQLLERLVGFQNSFGLFLVGVFVILFSASIIVPRSLTIFNNLWFCSWRP